MVTKGAPDVLLTRCRFERVGSGVRELTDQRRAEILADVDRLSDQALRTLAVAYRPLPDTDAPKADSTLEHELVHAGVVGIIDPPRPEAADAVAEARKAGVRTVMITGDHPRTAARIATSLGITGPGALARTGLELDRLDEEELRRTVQEVSVYARVAPEHKLRIVDALQADGHIVAMTGDGVNDAPALKSADIGIAMGITGTEVTKEAAKMILADDNFATIVVAVREGRAIFANIRKFLHYLLSSNIGEVLTVFGGVVAASLIGLDVAGGGIVAPLLATQILWVNLLTDTGPALAMGVDPPTEDMMSQPPRAMTDRIIDREMQLSVLLVGVVMAAATLLTTDLKLPGGLIRSKRGLDDSVERRIDLAMDGRGEVGTGMKELVVLGFASREPAEEARSRGAELDRDGALRCTPGPPPGAAAGTAWGSPRNIPEAARRSWLRRGPGRPPRPPRGGGCRWHRRPAGWRRPARPVARRRRRAGPPQRSRPRTPPPGAATSCGR